MDIPISEYEKKFKGWSESTECSTQPNMCIFSPREYKRFMKDMKNFKPKSDEYWNRKPNLIRKTRNRFRRFRDSIHSLWWLRKKENRDYVKYGCTDWREW